MEEIPSKKQMNPGLASDSTALNRTVFLNVVMQLHKKLTNIESDHATSPEDREKRITDAVLDFYDYLAMDELLEAWRLNKDRETGFDDF